MFLAASLMPRKILPPPTTTPTCTPACAMAAISPARPFTRSGSIPKESGPAMASPLSFRSMRLKRATVIVSALLFRDFKACKAGDRDILAQFGNFGLDQLIDGESVLLHERLIVQADLFVVLGHPAFDNLVGDLLRLSFGDCPGALNILLFFERFSGHVFASQVLRIGRGDLHRQVFHQFLKIVGASHEVRLTVDFYQYPELSARVNVRADKPLLGAAR